MKKLIYPIVIILGSSGTTTAIQSAESIRHHI